VSFLHGTKARWYLESIDASGYVKEVAADLSIDTAETTTLLSGGKEYIVGLPAAQLSTDGYFDGNVATDATSFSFYVESLVGLTNKRVIYLPQGDGLGNVGYGFNGMLDKQSIKTNKGDVGTATLEFVSTTGSLERGNVLHPLGAEVATNNTAGVDSTLVSGSTNGGVAYMITTAVTGTGGPTNTVKVQHSTNNSTWADLATFTAQTAVGSQRIVVASGTTVNRYLRAQWTIAGTTPSFTFAVLFARK
jgi:hypothetical protein